jgi:hypothetical protein
MSSLASYIAELIVAGGEKQALGVIEPAATFGGAERRAA